MALLRKTVVCALFFGAGYLYNQPVGQNTQPYEIVQDKNVSYVRQTSTGVKLPITGNFQLGTLDYRLEGLKHETLAAGNEELYFRLKGVTK